MNTHNEEERNQYSYNMHNEPSNMNYDNMSYNEMIYDNMDYNPMMDNYDNYKQEYHEDKKHHDYYDSYKHGYENITKEMFDPMDGLYHGNMFKDLYKGYKHHKVYKIEPMNEQAKLLTKIDALEFAMNDINLYLDTYAEDKEMMNLYNKYKHECMNAIREYEEKYGPLFATSASQKHIWSWSMSPWPWEV